MRLLPFYHAWDRIDVLHNTPRKSKVMVFLVQVFEGFRPLTLNRGFVRGVQWVKLTPKILRKTQLHPYIIEIFATLCPNFVKFMIFWPLLNLLWSPCIICGFEGRQHGVFIKTPFFYLPQFWSNLKLLLQLCNWINTLRLWKEAGIAQLLQRWILAHQEMAGLSLTYDIHL